MNNKRQRNKLFTMLLLVMALLIPQQGWAHHSYNFNGFCTDEDCSEKYEPAMIRNDWYEIQNAGQLYWFAEQVDNGNQDLINANVRLINDIFDNDVTFSYDAENDYAPIATDAAGKNVDVSTLRVWNPIGIQEGIQDGHHGGLLADEKYSDKKKWFGGHFEGNNFSISGLYFNDSETLGGLFAFLRYTSKIENVRIENSYFKGKAVGSIAAHLEGGTVSNCHNNSFLIGSYSAGGILAEAMARFWTGSECTSLVKVSNCINDGLVVGTYDAAGIVAFSAHGSGNYLWLINMAICKCKNYTPGEIIGTTQSSGLVCLNFCFGYGANNVLIGTNSNYAKISNSAIVSDESMHTGKMAYLLSQIDSNWGQNLNDDDDKDIPEYDSKKVYKLCGDNYTNDASEKATHHWENGICSTCGDKQSPIFNEITNCYEIENYGQLMWFDERFGFGSPKENETINAILTADIVIDKRDGNNNNLAEWMSLGDACSFNGQGHTISGFCANNGNVFCNGSVKNLNLVNAKVSCYRNIKIGGIASSTEKPILNCSFKGEIIGYQVGGIAAYTNSTVSNCSFEGSITMEKTLPDDCLKSIQGRIGGLVMNLGSKGNINNCSFVGKCIGNNSQDNKLNTLIGGLVEENNGGKVSNCFASATFSDLGSGDNNGKYYYIVIKNNGNINRIAYDSEKNTMNFLVGNGTDSGASQDIQSFTTQKINSGEVTYWLNEGKTDGNQAWYQKLSEGGDEHPVLKPTGDNTVYYAYQHGTANQFYSNEVNSHKLAYNAEAEDEANGNHDVSYEAGEYTWTDEDKTQAPTVAVTYTCKVCGKTETPQMPVEHDAEHANVAATCTEEGHNYYKTSYTFNDKAVFSNAYTQTLPALGHEMSEDVTFNDGKSIYQKGCTRENCDHHDYYATSDGSVAAKANDEASAFTVEAFTLDDATAYDNKAKFTVKELTYKRTFKNDGWQAVYVPFGLECGQINQDYEVANINNFHEYEQTDGNTKLELEVKRVTNAGSIPALTPCLIRKKQVSDIESETAEPFHFTDVTFVPAEDKSIDCASVTRYYQFVGTLQGKSDFDESSDFCIGQGNLWPAVNGKELSPQRWYLKATDRTGGSIAPTAQLSRIGIRVIGDGEATGIENIHVTTDYGTSESGKQGIYDLQGRKLDKEPTSGIYIKNGKKYVK